MSIFATVFSILYYPLLVIVVILLVLVSVVLFSLLKAFFKYQSTKAPFLSSDIFYRYPGIFPIGFLFRPNSFKDYLHEMVDKEGNLKHKVVYMGPHFDGSPLVFINDANYFKEATNEERCPKLEFMYDSFKIVLGEGLVTSSGALWKRQRRLLTPIFHFQNLKQMPDIMTRNIVKFIKDLENLNGKEVRASSTYAELTLAIIIDCVFGGEEFLSYHKLSKLWETANLSLNNYFLSCLVFGTTLNNLLSFIPYNKKIINAMKEIRHNITDAIKKKRQQISSGNYSEDLLSALLTVTDKETGQPIPDDLIIDECLTFLFAGHDTTSSLMSFCSLHLIERKDVVEKLREEIDNVLGDREIPEYEDISKFHYCRMVLHETLRMCPPVPTLDRRCAEPFTVEGFEIPAGSCFNYNSITAHYDNRYWKDPFTFRPERWDTSNKEETERHPFAFIPFSAGTRNCIGQKFSIMEATLALVMIIRKFDIVSSQKYDDVIWDFEGTVKPVNFKCSFKLRND